MQKFFPISLFKTLLIFFFFSIMSISALSAQSFSKSKAIVLGIMENQENAWNKGSLEEFMIGYWENDSLKFIGKSGLTYGWNQTLSNYKKSYPNPEAMGKLHFTILHVTPISNKAMQVIGKWQLIREKDAPSGHFTLLWRKIEGKWVIVADHSS